MKKPVKIAVIVLLLILAAFWYLSSSGTENTEAEDSEIEFSNEETEETVSREETESASTLSSEAVQADLQEGFSDRQKEELKEIISSCLEENLNALMEDGRLPAALGNYATVSAGLININTADAEELTKLTGIGPAKAAEIVKYREEHGAFLNVEDLTGVPGISTGTLEKLREQVTL